ncbi:adenylate/guanylate cyclase domain-containing protein [Kocuria rosea]|uniref:adenylate/guanylate cyclase domain-containing protein n=1 Tax=Kocuria rosea TaxID=1275 RepID=UPI0020424CA7|nr:adenylate/guanylate cyclase domain-containing protein [Kocuria rosea]MCM3687889.1 adenylate/guanylate cyclase domain-containing protein [Kocuria rosea]
MASEDSETQSEPVVGPQTEQLNLNLHNPVQANLYRSDESKAAVGALERTLLGSERGLRRREAARRGGLSLLSARKVWRALGFPNLTDDDVWFTEQDSEALRVLSTMVLEEKVTEEAALSLVRSIGQMTDRMVVWQVEALVEDMVVHEGMTDAAARRQLLHLLPDLIDAVERLLVYSWRRQMNAAVQRLAMRVERPDGSTSTDGASEEGGSILPLARGVGFADLVSYTSLSRQMNERTLANLVQRFEHRCAEVIAVGGGRLIKTIGDEVMFLAESPQGGAQISLALARAIRDDPELPQARVAFVWGRVLPRLGDIYGPTVNLASRLVALTDPGSVLVDASTAAVLAGDDRFILIPQATRNVRGFGDVQPVALSQGAGPGLEVDFE